MKSKVTKNSFEKMYKTILITFKKVYKTILITFEKMYILVL